MLFDSHTHLTSEDYPKEVRDNLIKDIEDSDVAYVVDVGCDLETSKLAVDNAKRYDWCYATVGVHPHETKSMDETVLFMIESLAKKDKVVAIGEIGLDFHYDHSPRDVQIYRFREQIKLANRLKMPIAIHSRDADALTLEILKEEKAFSPERKKYFATQDNEGGKNSATATKIAENDARVLIHCFSGSAELAEQYIKLGATISVAGPVTYKNNKKTQRVVQTVPIERLLIETDAPFLTPEPHRGKTNKSPYVEHTARRVALLKDMEYEDVARITCENAKRFFNIDK